MRSMKTGLVLILALSTCSVSGSPYQGQQHRDIKALAAIDIDGYLAGAGMGMAKAAELNDYPGPKHVLELADELELNFEQREQTRVLFAAMKEKASTLGEQLVVKERTLDRWFANRTIDAASLDALLSDIGKLQSAIRYTHLETHLSQRALLNEEQVHRYRQLRGYHNGGVHHRGDGETK